MDTKDSFSDMRQKVADAAAATGQAADDLAACVPEVARASAAFDRLAKAAEPLRPEPASKMELLRAASTLAERAGWHLKSAMGCIIAGAIKKPERFLQAYRQLIRANDQIAEIADEIERRFPELKPDVEYIRKSISASNDLARSILMRETDLPFVRSASDGHGPKSPLS